MTSKERFFTLIIIFTLLSTNIHGLHKNAEQSTNDSIVNVTRKSHDSSGSVKNTPKPIVPLNLWPIICFSVAIIFMLATFIVYSVVPELKNLQGWIVRSYLASYICLMILLIPISILMDDFVTFSDNIYPGLPFIVGIPYFGFASLMWMNVMSYDIWRKFRKIRSSRFVNFRKQQRVTFIRYSTYSWGVSFILLLVCLALLCGVTTKVISQLIPFYSVVALISISFTFNIFFHTMTALKINKRKKETADVFDEASKHSRKNKQWFSIYLKLFVIMGCHVILWAVLSVYENNTLTTFVYSVEPVQSVLIFFIFVWKDDVRNSVHRELTGSVRRVGSIFQRDPTPQTTTRF